MRVAFLTPEYVTEEFGGGLANYTFRTARGLVARGHDVHVFTLSKTTAHDDTQEHDGIVVHRVALGQRADG